MDAKKIIGVAIAVVILIVLGYAIINGMSEMTSAPTEQNPMVVSPKNTQPVRPGLSEEPQSAPLPDVREPATVDAIVDDLEKEVVTEQSAMESEVLGESSILENEATSLNEVSQFYDENSL
ncbi:MAG: hypothetical protein KA054_00415 [Candidatus Moranbacteria bacterium]|nr:hypothetical protein [Candidatus Moranbacteria bacterium]